MPANEATRRRRHIAAAPIVPVELVDRVAERATLDAMDLAADIRTLDPREVWGRMAIWAEAEPLRLYAATVALAAMVDVDKPVSELLAWTDGLTGKGAA